MDQMWPPGGENLKLFLKINVRKKLSLYDYSLGHADYEYVKTLSISGSVLDLWRVKVEILTF